MSIKEAKKLMKEGDSALKTGIFKWSKDFATAAISYDEAFKIFKSLKDYDNAIIALQKNADVNEQMHDDWAKGRNYENIVNISIERTDTTTDPEKIVGWVKQVGFCCRTSKHPQTYVNLVKKVAKYFEDKGLELEASNLYKDLVNDLETDEEWHLKTEVVQQYAQLLVKLKKFKETLDLFEREYIDKKNQQAASGTKKNLDSVALTIISLNFILGDIDTVERRLQDFSIEIKDFIRAPEFDSCEKMLEAYIDGKQEDFDKQANRSIMNNIFPLNIINNLRKVKVKAMPGRRKVMEIDSGMDTYQTYGETNAAQNDETAPAVAPITEEQRQQALDDFLC